MDTVGTVSMNKVYASHVREQYAATLEAIAPKKLEDVVEGLEKHFAEQAVKGIELVQCDECLGWSPLEGFDACPFCNDGKKTDVAAPKNAPAIVDAVADGPPKKTKLVGLEAPPSSAPALLAGGRAVVASEKDLDEALAEYHTIARDTAEGIYRLGIVIRRMRDHLWQQRTENGKPKYKSFEQFVESELGISRSQANRHRRIVETFTKDQILDNPPSVLKALIAAPKEAHEDLLKMHKQGATAAAIEKKVKEIREEKGIVVIETEAMKDAIAKGKNIPSAATTAKAASARKKESAAITIGLKSEVGVVKLLAKPKKKGEDERRARTLDDQPYGKIEGINGVTLTVGVKMTATGELELRWAAKRDADE